MQSMEQTKSNNNTHIIQMSQHEMLTRLLRKNREKEEEKHQTGPIFRGDAAFDGVKEREKSPTEYTP